MQSSSPTTLASRAPGLNAFRLNPFRVLALPVQASPEQAVWQSEKRRALLRLGASAHEKAPLSWFPEPDEHEIHQALQHVEEPMRRLLAQLRWFDFAVDPRGAALAAALSSADPDALREYLTHELDSAEFAALGDEGAQEQASIAHEINRANLQVLLGLCALHDVGPTLDLGRVPAGARRSESAVNLRWSSAAALEVVEMAHERFAPDQDDGSRVRGWAAALQDGFAAWRALLQDPGFARGLRPHIEYVGDEQIAEDDHEAISVALGVSFAETLAGELRLMLLQGRDAEATALVALATRAPFSREMWRTATLTLKHHFEGELEELDSLIDNERAIDLDALEQHLQRLRSLFTRWYQLDPEDLLDLRVLADDATRRALQQVELSRDGIEGWSRHHGLLLKLSDMAYSPALQKRIEATVRKMDELRKHAICHYCRERHADLKLSAIVKRKKVTGVTHSGNTITTHYQVRAALVPRCQRCADVHEALEGTHLYLLLGVINIFCGPVVAIAIIASLGADPGYWLYLTAFVITVMTVIPGWLGGILFTNAISGKNDRRAKDVEDAEMVRELIADGYNEAHGIFLSKSAFEELKRSV